MNSRIITTAPDRARDESLFVTDYDHRARCDVEVRRLRGNVLVLP